jgi:D-arabinose 1-dehydrogenase-like Zn-dependent alcohol dehydrogenase
MTTQNDRKEKVVSIEEADALAFGSISNQKDNKFELIPFKFSELKDDEIRIKVLYSSLCHSDIAFSTGQWGDTMLLPCVPGHEFVGEVIAVGTEVRNVKMNDIVGFGCLKIPAENVLIVKKEKRTYVDQLKILWYGILISEDGRLIGKVRPNLLIKFQKKYH